MFGYRLNELPVYCLWLIFGKHANEIIVRCTSDTQKSLSSVSISYSGKSYLFPRRVSYCHVSLYYFGLRNCITYHWGTNFYVLLTAHPNIMIVFLFTNLMHKFFILIHFFYFPLHVSSTIMLIFRRTIVLVQHLV